MRTLVIVSMFLGLFLLALLLRAEFLFWPLWSLVAICLLARLWTRHTARYVRLHRHAPGHAFVGDEVRVDITVHNATSLPMPFLEINESVPVELQGEWPPSHVLSLGPHRRERVQYALACRRRGYYFIGPAEGRTGDVLGIERRDLRWGRSQQLIVYPQVVPLARLGLPTSSALVALRTPTGLHEDSTLIVGVRDYQRGDPLRRMHRTATARLGRPVVKQYEHAIDRAVLVCLDLDPRAYGEAWRRGLERAIVVAASLAHHVIVRERLSAGLAAHLWDPLIDKHRYVRLPPGPGRARLVSILELLARAQPPQEGTFIDLLWGIEPDLRRGVTVVAITGNVDFRLAEALLLLQRRGHAVAVVLVEPRRAHSEEPLDLRRIPIYRVGTDQTLGALG